MRTHSFVVVSTLLVLACTESPKPSTPAFGYYPLASVNGQAIPTTPARNACSTSFTGGGVNLTATSFDVEVDWTGDCPPSPTFSTAWHCSGVPPVALSATFELEGAYGQVGCGFRVTGYADRLVGRFVGPDSASWGDPQFELHPRQNAH